MQRIEQNIQCEYKTLNVARFIICSALGAVLTILLVLSIDINRVPLIWVTTLLTGLILSFTLSFLYSSRTNKIIINDSSICYHSNPLVTVPFARHHHINTNFRNIQAWRENTLSHTRPFPIIEIQIDDFDPIIKVYSEQNRAFFNGKPIDNEDVIKLISQKLETYKNRSDLPLVDKMFPFAEGILTVIMGWVLVASYWEIFNLALHGGTFMDGTGGWVRVEANDWMAWLTIMMLAIPVTIVIVFTVLILILLCYKLVTKILKTLYSYIKPV